MSLTTTESEMPKSEMIKTYFPRVPPIFESAIETAVNNLASDITNNDLVVALKNAHAACWYPTNRNLTDAVSRFPYISPSHSQVFPGSCLSSALGPPSLSSSSFTNSAFSSAALSSSALTSSMLQKNLPGDMLELFKKKAEQATNNTKVVAVKTDVMPLPNGGYSRLTKEEYFLKDFTKKKMQLALLWEAVRAQITYKRNSSPREKRQDRVEQFKRECLLMHMDPQRTIELYRVVKNLSNALQSCRDLESTTVFGMTLIRKLNGFVPNYSTPPGISKATRQLTRYFLKLGRAQMAKGIPYMKLFYENAAIQICINPDLWDNTQDFLDELVYCLTQRVYTFETLKLWKREVGDCIIILALKPCAHEILFRRAIISWAHFDKLNVAYFCLKRACALCPDNLAYAKMLRSVCSCICADKYKH